MGKFLIFCFVIFLIMFGIYLYSYPGAFEKDLSQTGSSILKWFNGESARAPSAQVPAAARTAGDGARTVSQEVPAASTESLPPSAQALSADFQTRSTAIAPVNYSQQCLDSIETCRIKIAENYDFGIDVTILNYSNEGLDFQVLGPTGLIFISCRFGILYLPERDLPAAERVPQDLNNQLNC